MSDSERRWTPIGGVFHVFNRGARATLDAIPLPAGAWSFFPESVDDEAKCGLCRRMVAQIEAITRRNASLRLADEVIAEGQRAADLHGEPANRGGLDWLAILAEEVGEVAREVCQGEVPPVAAKIGYPDRLRAELVQVASVALRWIGALDRGEGVRRG